LGFKQKIAAFSTAGCESHLLFSFDQQPIEDFLQAGVLIADSKYIDLVAFYLTPAFAEEVGSSDSFSAISHNIEGLGFLVV